MTNFSFRNFICIVGLASGLTLISVADLAHADVRQYADAEVGQFTEAGGLPGLCEVTTVTAKRPEEPITA